MSAKSDTDDDDRYVATRLESAEHKREARIHAAEKGYSTMAAYLRALVYEDLGIETDE